jgi:hypothetical protein
MELPTNTVHVSENVTTPRQYDIVFVERAAVLGILAAIPEPGDD